MKRVDTAPAATRHHPPKHRSPSSMRITRQKIASARLRQEQRRAFARSVALSLQFNRAQRQKRNGRGMISGHPISRQDYPSQVAPSREGGIRSKCANKATSRGTRRGRFNTALRSRNVGDLLRANGKDRMNPAPGARRALECLSRGEGRYREEKGSGR